MEERGRGGVEQVAGDRQAGGGGDKSEKKWRKEHSTLSEAKRSIGQSRMICFLKKKHRADYD